MSMVVIILMIIISYGISIIFEQSYESTGGLLLCGFSKAAFFCLVCWAACTLLFGGVEDFIKKYEHLQKSNKEEITAIFEQEDETKNTSEKITSEIEKQTMQMVINLTDEEEISLEELLYGEDLW